jgi:hypothetical protein
MTNRLINILFAVCAVIVFTAQTNRPDVERKPVSRATEAQRGPAGQNNQARPQGEPARAPQGSRNDQGKSAIRTSQVNHNIQAKPPVRPQPQVFHREDPQQARAGQSYRQERSAPRVYAVPAPIPMPVVSNQMSQRTHHRNWQPLFNFYENQYHFYPYVNVASKVELSSKCVSVLYGGQAYFYDQGTFYEQDAQGYLAIPPIIGVLVDAVPAHAVRNIIDGVTYYRFKGVFYMLTDQGYQVVPPLNV